MALNLRPGGPTPGRNNVLENIWRFLTGWGKGEAIGTQRPRAVVSLGVRNLNLEIPEWPIRDRHVALELIEMVHNQPEVKQALSVSTREIFSSEDGDDQAGVQVSEFLDIAKTERLNPELHKAASECLARVFPLETLHHIARPLLGYGDRFASLVIEGGRSPGVNRLLLLPTWEMFRVETDSGELLGFEQRRDLDDRAPIRFHPGMIVHWRYDRRGLYGQSQFSASLPDWREYKRALIDKAMARREIGVNPTLYEFDDTYGQQSIDAWQQANEAGYRHSDAPITRLYLPAGIKASKLNNSDPDLGAITADLESERMAFIRASEQPIWYFAGADSTGARDISGQPALAHSRLVNHRRQSIGVGIKQVLITDLVLKFGVGVLAEVSRLRLDWPQFHVRPQDTADAQTQEPPADPTKSGDKPRQADSEGLSDTYRRLEGLIYGV